jgi:hypothetical protein
MGAPDSQPGLASFVATEHSCCVDLNVDIFNLKDPAGTIQMVCAPANDAWSRAFG